MGTTREGNGAAKEYAGWMLEPGEFLGAFERIDASVPHALFVMSLEQVDEIPVRCGRDGEQALLHLLEQILLQQLGEGIIAARLAASRLAVLRPHCLPRDAAALARRLRTALQGGQFIWHGRHFRLGASIGVLELGNSEGSVEKQLAMAIQASDVARSLGGDGVVMTSGDPVELMALERTREWREHLGEVI